jgi:predicted RNA binding protein YcfA (HicA-like mRNA interferase family)
VTGTLPVVSGEDTIRALARAGFVPVSTRGSHQKLRHPDGRTVIVPLHRGCGAGPLASILIQAHMAAEEFRVLLKS